MNVIINLAKIQHEHPHRVSGSSGQDELVEGVERQAVDLHIRYNTKRNLIASTISYLGSMRVDDLSGLVLLIRPHVPTT